MNKSARSSSFALLASIATTSLVACGDSGSSDPPPTCFTIADGSCAEETFASPPVLEPDADGVYKLSLAATEVMLEGKRHCVRAYNGSYLAPTIETAARQGEGARSIRVDLSNRMTGHDYRSLEGGSCTCRDEGGKECVPAHVHDRCIPDDESCSCFDEDGAACEHMFDFNVTNLHAHGSHVRPDYARGGEPCEPRIEDGVVLACRECGDDVCGDTGDDACFNGDNVLNAVHPNAGAQYRWDIDEDGTHHAGLNWYHPHIHGTTAIQVASGAAGAWIVRGELDALDGIRDARERVMVLSTPPIGDGGFAPLEDGVECTDATITFNDFDTLGATDVKQRTLVNGVRRPRMLTPPGQVERWRIVHAGFLDEVYLGLFRGADASCESFSTAAPDTIRLTQIGRDGITLPETFEDDYLFMSPGYRIEAVLGGAAQLKDGETWCLVAARFLQDGDDDGGFSEETFAPPDPPTKDGILARFESDGDVVAVLNVTASAGAATTQTLPSFPAIAALAPSTTIAGTSAADRCAAAADVTDPAAIDEAAILQVGFWTADDPDPCDCPNYNVNCRNFEKTDRALRPFDRDLPLGAVEHWRVTASFDGHPFHIHINPFLACPNENPFDPLPFPHWRDTYLLNVARSVDLIAENRAFTGPYVLHCHKLTHEDHGMMELIRVCDPAEDATCGDNGWRACAEDDLACTQALAATDCALGSESPAETAACVTLLGGPAGVCGPNACSGDADCDSSAACDGSVCQPAPCPAPCAPPETCQHGTCG